MFKKIAVAALLLFLPGLGLAQEFRASISGHVVDASGGAVPAAKVQALNIANNESTSATTDASGSYTIPLLRPGTYRLTATATGFKQYVRDNLILEAAKVVGVEIKLELGSLTETVEVTAEAAMLETQSASRGGIVTTQQVSELPLNARNPFMLGAMMSGVTFNGAAIWQRPFDNGAIAEWSINGSRNSSAEFFLDGASNNGQMGSNNIAYVPVVDAVQEFSVMSNTYNAEYGHTGGGILNVVLKSGTNTFHATGWEFLRRTALDANTFQNNAAGTKRPTHYLDQWGFQLEGPAVIPHLLQRNGKVQLFYLGTFEGYREGTPNPLNVSWPEPEMRTGDFSKLVTSLGQKITIYDPLNYTLDANKNPVRVPFPDNRIPQDRINPIALNVAKYMPLPNRAAPAGSRYSTSNLFIPDYFDKDKFYNLILKFDFNFGNKHRTFFRHASNDRTEDRAVNGLDNRPGTDGQQPFQRINDAYAADWVATISPSLILNVRGSFNRFIEKGFGRANEGFDVASFGLPKDLISTLPSPIYFGRWNFNGYNSLGRSQSNNYTNTYEAQANITKVWHSHTFKVGFDIRQINYLQQNTGDILSFTGNTSWTQQYNRGDATQGDGFATFLLGIVSGSSNYPLFPWWRQYYAAPYLNDDWKVTRRLTLNLGIRLDLNQPAHEKWNRQNGPFDPNLPNPVAAQIPAAMLERYPQLRNLKGGMTFAGVNGIPSVPAHFNKANWGPRVGFAYQLRDKLVMRGGVGLFYSNPNNDIFRTAGFSTSTSIVNSLDGSRTPIPSILSNPFPNGINHPTGSSLGPLTFLGRNDSWFDPTFKTPKNWQFSFGFQYQLSGRSTLTAEYVGSRSYDQTMQKDFNIPSLEFRKQCNLLEGGSPIYCDEGLPNPFRNVPAFQGTGYYTASTISRFNLNRPFPQFNGNLTQLGRNDSTIWYNSFQLNYNLRLRGDITLLGNYTLSKQVEEWGFNDPYTNTYQQGLYYLDRPHVLKVTPVVELPFGRGKHFGSGAHGIVDKLISGWEYSAIFTDAFRGFPNDLPGNVIQLKDPQTPLRDASGDFVMGANGKPVYDGGINWKAYEPRAWNPCVLRQQNDGSIAPSPNSLALGCGSQWAGDWGNYVWLQTAGYAPRFTPSRSGQIRRHHAFTLDMSITKMTRITERLRFQLGFEAFNAFNHNYYGRNGFNTDPASSNFGTIRPSTVSTQNMLPRQIQVRMKFFW